MSFHPRVVLCAPYSFKESLTASDAAAAMAAGVQRADSTIECRQVPVSDGGEGFADVIVTALCGTWLHVPSLDAMGRSIAARVGLVPDRGLAVIESASACGLELIAPNERDVLRASTWGVGEAITAALDVGARHLLIGLGGTATNDAGAGMMQALGARLLDAQGRDLAPGGGSLAALASVDLTGLDERLTTTEVTLAVDVDAVLLGPAGASATFGPQKGATSEQCVLLDAALGRWADVVEATTGRRVRDVPGSGAAGGLAAALMALTNSRVASGADLVLDTIDLDSLLTGADLVLTGEGSVDAQSGQGKVVSAVIRRAETHRVPVVVFGGRVAPHAREELGVPVIEITPSGVDRAEALARASDHLTEAVARYLIGVNAGS